LLVSKHRESGLSNVELTPGDHVCAMFFGQQERDDIVVPYLEAGLRAGDKCMCIVPSPPLDALAARIGDEHAVESFIASQQLELRLPVDVFLKTLPFTTESMMEWWEKSVGEAAAAGQYEFGRATGEMPVEWQAIPRAEWFRYEAELNRFLLRYPQFIVCLYDLERFGGGFMIDLLRTHPKLLIGGLLLENPHWIPPSAMTSPAA
jgi:DcmR-like sensory protein